MSGISKIPDLYHLVSIGPSWLLKDNNPHQHIKEIIFNTLDRKFILGEIEDGYEIRSGINPQLDECRERSSAHEFIEKFEQTERHRLNYPKLKVGYNRVQGYYIEISKASNITPPDHYHRKQTLKNSERYVTEELSTFEQKIMSAKFQQEQLEKEIYHQLLQSLKNSVEKIRILSSTIALIDVMHALTITSNDLNWYRPSLVNQIGIHFQNGRHPMVESQLKSPYIPNHLSINENSCLKIITGPNMGGKSTYMRQCAIIVLLAHIGCYVPANECVIGPIDKIFTRIGASDDISQGQSTFMVEMQETANIIRNATPSSLVIMDEVGRGTSTYDGLAIANACIEYLVKHIKAMCLFATHYFELTSLSDKYPSIENLHVAVNEHDQKIVFLHQIKPGTAEKSYGIHVAKLAGMPSTLIILAQQRLIELEQKTKGNTIHSSQNQTTLRDHIIQQINQLDINAISPKEAWDFVNTLKDLIKEPAN